MDLTLTGLSNHEVGYFIRFALAVWNTWSKSTWGWSIVLLVTSISTPTCLHPHCYALIGLLVLNGKGGKRRGKGKEKICCGEKSQQAENIIPPNEPRTPYLRGAEYILFLNETGQQNSPQFDFIGTAMVSCATFFTNYSIILTMKRRWGNRSVMLAFWLGIEMLLINSIGFRFSCFRKILSFKICH